MGWFRKVVEVEKKVEVEKTVERFILGTPEPVKLYAAQIMTFAGRCERYYHSCAQALAENPGATVREIQIWRIGDLYLNSLKVARVEVQPKPKRAKGKGAAA